MRRLAIAATCFLTAILIAGLVSAQSVGIGIKKTAPLSGTGSSGSPLKIDVCLSGSAYVSNGTSWECAAGASGDIEGVTAGNGMTGGGTTGTVTLDVACGTGLSCAADAVNLNLTGASCSAGQYMSALGSTGTGTCTAEVGDISTVTTTANMGLTGGGTSGAVSVGLLSTCADGEVLKSGSSGTTWSCAADSGGSYTAGDGLTLTGSDFDITYTSDFTITTDQLDLSTAVTAPGSLSVATTLDVDGGLAKFGSGADGYTYIAENQLNFGYATNSSFDGAINYAGYNGGLTQFRGFAIYDGKGAAVADFNGATKAFHNIGPVDLDSTLNVDGATTVNEFRGTQVSPTAISGVNSDWAGLSNATFVYLTTSGSASLTGMTGGAAARTVTICNVGADSVTLYHDTTSTAANRFYLPGNTDWIMSTKSCADFRYSTTSSRWYMSSWSNSAFPTMYVYGTSTLNGAATVGLTLAVSGNTTHGDANTDVVNNWGKSYYYGTAPTLSGCTASCTMAGYSTDARGRITCTDSPGTDCTVTFSVAYDTNPPACSLTYEDATAPTAAPYIVSISTSAFSFDVLGGAQAHAWSYRCDGML